MPPVQDDNVSFQSDQPTEFGSPPDRDTSSMTKWLIDSGIVSSESQAQSVLLGVAILALIAMGIFLYKAF